MIQFEFPEPDSRIWKLWRTACKKATAELQEHVGAGNKPVIKNLYKRQSVKTKYYFSKTGLFHGKCAYCETDISQTQQGDIEHFRPKLGVTDENDQVIEVDYGAGQPEPHKGYYWLAYEWRNLLPACAFCNQPRTVDGRKIGKHNRFPVQGAHATTADGVKDEVPLLISPLEEDPENHLSVDAATGIMTALTEQGRMCIDVFGLNDRDVLQQRRQMVALIVKDRFLAWRDEQDPQKRAERYDEFSALVEEIKTGQREWSLAGRCVLNEIAVGI